MRAAPVNAGRARSFGAAPATPANSTAPANGGFDAPKPEVHNATPPASDPFGNLGAKPVKH